jgi:hypothetical protein
MELGEVGFEKGAELLHAFLSLYYVRIQPNIVSSLLPSC